MELGWGAGVSNGMFVVCSLWSVGVFGHCLEVLVCTPLASLP